MSPRNVTPLRKAMFLLVQALKFQRSRSMTFLRRKSLVVQMDSQLAGKVSSLMSQRDDIHSLRVQKMTQGSLLEQTILVILMLTAIICWANVL